MLLGKKKVWDKLGMYKVIKKACVLDRAGEAVLELLLLMPHEELSILVCQNARELIAITAWYLWWDRRKLVHEGKSQDAHQTSMGARAITANYFNAYSSKAIRKIGGWSIPPRGFVKLNVDAAFHHDLLQGTAGAVLRDDKGRFIVRGNWWIEWCDNVLTAEVLALKFGLFLAQKAGCNRLVVNSDNMEVIDIMKNGGHSAGVAAVVFDDCYFMACDFTLIRFEHCNREANKVADELARLAKFSPFELWMDSAPSAIIPILVYDATILTHE